MSNDQPRRSPRRFGDYELLEKVGTGAMGSVYKARDTQTNDIVAVKIAARHVINNPDLSRRFELEYKIAKPLKHPNLVKVIASGEHEARPFLVMEFIAGQSLAQLLKPGKPLSENDALAILLPIADAVSYLHTRQIIHRDIKPGNILVDAAGHAKLADLGLIKDMESVSQLTRSNYALGTAQFAAPEQFESAKDVDVRTDVYALAATLYVMVTGEYPFGKGAALSVLKRKMQHTFEAPIAKSANVRPCVDRAIRMALDVDRKRRPGSVREFTAFLTGDKTFPADVAQPSAAKTPKPSPAAKSAKKSADERRADFRHPVELEAQCRALGNARQRWPAWIIDFSLSGMCLRMPRRFEAGSVLEVSFTLQSDKNSERNQLLRVRWVQTSEKKTWLLGCEFANPITDEEIDAIIADGMDHTNML